MISALANRAHYSTLSDSVYLNQASLGLIGQPAVTAMHDFLETVARHGNLAMSDRQELEFCAGLRQRGAALFNAKPSQLAIVASASEVLAQLPFLLDPDPASRILLVASDFPAITRPWLRLAAVQGCTTHFVADDPEQDLTTALIDAIDERTAIVAVGSVQFATGSCIDIPRLRRACEQVGARLIVDATQAAGAMVVDARDWDADVIVSSGYKWLGGHGGVALAVMAPRLLERMPPLAGWMDAPEPFAFDATAVAFADDARRYTQSTLAYISIVGLSAALDQLALLGIEHNREHALKLATVLVDGAAQLGWYPYRRPGAPGACPHITSLAAEGIRMQAVQHELSRQGITCSSRGGRIRVSLTAYNDGHDVNTFLEAIDRARRI